MARWWFLLTAVIILALGLGQVGNVGHVAASRPRAATLAAKVPPDVEGLAELAAGNGPDAFEAALKLRTVGDERAVEPLAGVLAEHIRRRSTATHGFAAAQALFCIGTPRAKQALSQYLLSGDYRADMGIDYAFLWEMPAEKRDAFIEEYHLKSTSKELVLSLQVQQDEQHAGRLDATATLCNVSDRPLRVADPKVYQAGMLVLRSKDGHFVNKCQTCLYKLPPGGEASYGELASGKCRVYKLSGQVRDDHSDSWPRWRDLAGGDMVIDFADVRHFIGKAGRFTVQAMLCSAPPASLAGAEGASDVWCGRVVSQPVEVEIRPVVQTD